MKRFIVLMTVMIAAVSCTSSVEKDFAAIALEESVIPVHPGVPGEVPFWNHYSRRFIYAPAFDYGEVEGAVKYRFDVASEADSCVYSFIGKKPWEALSPVWKEVPVGFFTITVTGIGPKGGDLAQAGTGRYYRAAPFGGEYNNPPVLPYDQSARVALDTLMNKPWVRSWLTDPRPDPDYALYRYPTKILSALVIGAITHSKLHAGTPLEEESARLARIVADYLLDLRLEEGSLWEYHTPTYRGYTVGKDHRSHIQEWNIMTIYGTDAGNAWLDMYDFTSDPKYLEAARLVAQTYVKRQSEDGSWYLLVDLRTGEPYCDQIVIPTQIINYFDRLMNDYGVSGLEQARAKSLRWIEDNVMKTYCWMGQFEDITPRLPYQNLSREQACDYAIYLLRHGDDAADNVDKALELLRFAEDQFVIWEQAMPFKVGGGKKAGSNSKNWIAPCVQEQYVFWMPVTRSAAIMIEAFWQAYETTGNEMFLAKAKSIANTITVMQEGNGGIYSTMSYIGPWNYWLNSTVYPARTMTRLQHNIENL